MSNFMSFIQGAATEAGKQLDTQQKEEIAIRKKERDYEYDVKKLGVSSDLEKERLEFSSGLTHRNKIAEIQATYGAKATEDLGKESNALRSKVRFSDTIEQFYKGASTWDDVQNSGWAAGLSPTEINSTYDTYRKTNPADVATKTIKDVTAISQIAREKNLDPDLEKTIVNQAMGKNVQYQGDIDRTEIPKDVYKDKSSRLNSLQGAKADANTVISLLQSDENILTLWGDVASQAGKFGDYLKQPALTNMAYKTYNETIGAGRTPITEDTYNKIQQFDFAFKSMIPVVGKQLGLDRLTDSDVKLALNTVGYSDDIIQSRKAVMAKLSFLREDIIREGGTLTGELKSGKFSEDKDFLDASEINTESTKFDSLINTYGLESVTKELETQLKSYLTGLSPAQASVATKSIKEIQNNPNLSPAQRAAKLQKILP